MKLASSIIVVCGIGLAAALAGCGQKGPLFLPGQPRNAPWPAPAPSPAAGDLPASRPGSIGAPASGTALPEQKPAQPA